MADGRHMQTQRARKAIPAGFVIQYQFFGWEDEGTDLADVLEHERPRDLCNIAPIASTGAGKVPRRVTERNTATGLASDEAQRWSSDFRSCGSAERSFGWSGAVRR